MPDCKGVLQSSLSSGVFLRNNIYRSGHVLLPARKPLRMPECENVQQCFNIPAVGPGMGAFYTLLIRNGDRMRDRYNNDRMHERVTTVRNMAGSMGFYRRLPFVYPIVVSFSSRRAE